VLLIQDPASNRRKIVVQKVRAKTIAYRGRARATSRHNSSDPRGVDADPDCGAGQCRRCSRRKNSCIRLRSATTQGIMDGWPSQAARRAFPGAHQLEGRTSRGCRRASVGSDAQRSGSWRVEALAAAGRSPSELTSANDEHRMEITLALRMRRIDLARGKLDERER